MQYVNGRFAGALVVAVVALVCAAIPLDQAWSKAYLWNGEAFAGRTVTQWCPRSGSCRDVEWTGDAFCSPMVRVLYPLGYICLIGTNVALLTAVFTTVPNDLQSSSSSWKAKRTIGILVALAIGLMGIAVFGWLTSCHDHWLHMLAQLQHPPVVPDGAYTNALFLGIVTTVTLLAVTVLLLWMDTIYPPETAHVLPSTSSLQLP